MSVKWISEMWGFGLKGSELIIALAIADHADPDGRCSPGLDLLARKTSIEKRNIRRIISRLAEKSVLDYESRSGSGIKSGFQLKKRVNTPSFNTLKKGADLPPLAEAKKGVNIPSLNGRKGVNIPPFNEFKKGVIRATPPTPPYKDEPFKERNKSKKEEAAVAAASSAKKTRDPALLKTRPDLDDEAWLIHLRDLPENKGIAVAGLYARMLTWCEKKDETPSRRRLLVWLEKERADLPVTAPPPRRRSPDEFMKSRELTIEPFAPDDAPPPPAPLPAPDVPPEQARLWTSVLDALARGVSQPVFETWFRSIVFLGLSAENDALLLRARATTKAWVTRYYSELIGRTMSTLGLESFEIRWEVEADDAMELEAA